MGTATASAVVQRHGRSWTQDGNRRCCCQSKCSPRSPHRPRRPRRPRSFSRHCRRWHCCPQTCRRAHYELWGWVAWGRRNCGHAHRRCSQQNRRLLKLPLRPQLRSTLSRKNGLVCKTIFFFCLFACPFALILTPWMTVVVGRRQAQESVVYAEIVHKDMLLAPARHAVRKLGNRQNLHVLMAWVGPQIFLAPSQTASKPQDDHLIYAYPVFDEPAPAPVLRAASPRTATNQQEHTLPELKGQWSNNNPFLLAVTQQKKKKKKKNI
jgi:hypothetical protein